MDKAKTLEVLRGMKFMQRKEEAKRRATFEVAQREQIERQLHTEGGASNDGSSSSGGAGLGTSSPHNRQSGPARATILYDDAFPIGGYGVARRAYTEALGGPRSGATAGSADDTTESLTTVEGAVTAASNVAESGDKTARDRSADSFSEEEVEDLWGGEDGESEDDADPTAAPGKRASPAKKVAASGQRGGRTDGRFTVQSAVRAPKLPRRLEESVTEEERQRKRRRREEENGDDAGYY